MDPVESVITFRPMNLEDLSDATLIAKWDADPAIRHLILPIRSEAQAGMFETPEEVLKRHRDVPADPTRARGFMVVVDGRAVGTGSVQMDPPHKVSRGDRTAWLGIVIGEASARGRGLGRRVLTELERVAREMGAVRAEAGVFEFNIASLRLFARARYRELTRVPKFTLWDGKWWDDVRFGKEF